MDSPATNSLYLRMISKLNSKIYLYPTICFLAFACQVSDMDLPSKVDFNFHIKPILSDRCFACHGPDENTREADLSLHTESGAFAVLDDERYIIKPGDAKSSEVYHRISSTDPEYMMPPPESNLSITDREIAMIEKWINQGAQWKRHWSFIPPVQPGVPKSKSHFIKNEIDAFTLEKMREVGLQPNEPATKGKWIRRVFFDLTGLPPTLEEIRTFEASDDNELAYEKVVDQLLASPHYGERMASVWLDLSRYADSHGYQDDRPRTMWPWRNWVIKAFNDNLPYDEFVSWQLAGDLFVDSNYEQKLATGFLRNHAITQEGGVINEEYLTEYAADRTNTFATAFLGLTMECARCHDHKYDPISQEDYYQLFGFFNNLKDERGQISYFDLAPVPNMLEQNPAREAEIENIKATIQQLQTELTEFSNRVPESFRNWQASFDPDQFRINENGLEAHYKLDEPQGWVFRNEKDPEWKGKVNINLPPQIELPKKEGGITGSALTFNGANFLSLGDVGDYDHHHSFSLGAWIKDRGKLKKDGSIIARRNGEQYRQGYDLFLTKNGRLGLRLVHNMYTKYLEVVTQASIPSNQWRHVFATYDGSGKASGVKLYINGEQQSIEIKMDSLQGLSILNGNDLLVGNWNHRARELENLWGFNGGTADEIMVFGRQLSGLEIQYIFRGQIKKQNLNADLLREHYLKNHDDHFQQMKSIIDSLRAIDLMIPHVMIAEERDTIHPSYVLSRGVYDAKIKPVSRGTPEKILPFSQEFTSDRKGLSDWLFAEDNPLTARVMVNRLWQQCFGQGLVSTPEDFGNQGNLPSHPELLDWLAVEFVSSGWDMKHMLKLVVLSGTYRQSNMVSRKQATKDKANVWLSRGPHQPLSAEMLRDHALKVSGLLNEKMYGKWVKPYQPAGIWKELANQIGENKYRRGQGADLYRRSVYTYFKRTIPPPTMLVLDAPDRAVCTVKRQATSTPLQALILLNDPTYVETSRALAERLMTSEADPTHVFTDAFNLLTGRLPSEQELNELFALYHELEDVFQAEPKKAKELLAVGQSEANHSIDPIDLASMTGVMNSILNLDETKHK